MGSRRRAREFALQALFQSDLGRKDARASLHALWEELLDDPEGSLGGRGPDSEEIEFATDLVSGVERNLDTLDETIERASTNWRVVRMAAVDRNLLRMGVYELMHREDVPPSVAINEAVELAKRYGTQESKGFVNGILDRVARDNGCL